VVGYSPNALGWLERPAVGVVHPGSGTFFRACISVAVFRGPVVRGEAGSLKHGVQIDAVLLTPVRESRVIPNAEITPCPANRAKSAPEDPPAAEQVSDPAPDPHIVPSVWRSESF